MFNTNSKTVRANGLSIPQKWEVGSYFVFVYEGKEKERCDSQVCMVRGDGGGQTECQVGR